MGTFFLPHSQHSWRLLRDPGVKFLHSSLFMLKNKNMKYSYYKGPTKAAGFCLSSEAFISLLGPNRLSVEWILE